ncbi:serine hydrolase domain-containing protein [Candidatus Riflebacteria bacterium]
MQTSSVRNKKYSKELQKVIQEHSLPGMAVGVIKNGRINFCEGFGYASLEWNKKAATDTVFEIASITKLFTAMAILKLREDGIIDLNQSIADFFNDIPHTWATIKIHHILSHRSGLINYTNLECYQKSTRLDVPRYQKIEWAKEHPLLFNPGQRWSYDNTGYLLLGYLIEKVSGMKYTEYLEQTIFQPAGLSSTGLNEVGIIVRNKARGYEIHDNKYKTAPYYSPENTFSDGGLLSTVKDLCQWMQAFFAAEIINAESMQKMLSPYPTIEQNEKGMGFACGYGWFLANCHGESLYGCNGCIKGYSTSLSHFPDRAMTFIFLTNRGEIDRPDLILHDAILPVFWDE